MTAACAETDRITATPTAAVVATASNVAPTATARPSTVAPTPTAVPPSASTAASSPSSAPTLPPGVSLPPLPSRPPLPSGATVVATGSVVFALAPGSTRMFEPANLAVASGVTSPSSAETAWTVAWRATDVLVASWYRQTGRTELGRGRWGTAELGGAGFELRNDGTANVFGELVYAIASR